MRPPFALRWRTQEGHRPNAPEPIRVEDLLERARRATGLDDFGPGDFQAPLSRLVWSLENEARLTKFGRAVARVRLRGHLVNRLRLQADRLREPAIAQEQIVRPLFIVGPPRTGTSILHRLLALDEQAMASRAWQIQTPSPPPPEKPSRLDPRFLRAFADELFLRLRLPGMRSIRDTRATLPEECCVLQAHAFASIVFSIAFDVPSYEATLLALDHADSYAWHRAFLQQFQHGARRRGAWVLKSPGHLLSLPELFRTYSDATIIQTHRDPLEFAPSLANLTRVLRSLTAAPSPAHVLGERVLQFWSTALDRARAFRAATPNLSDRFIDVHHDDVARDPIAVIERIYAHLGRPLTIQSRERMQRYLARHPRYAHGRHVYSLEAFRLDPRDVEARFRNDREAHGPSSAHPPRTSR